MPAATAKSAAAAPAAKTEREPARDERIDGRNAGIGTTMADPVDHLQGIAGNRAVAALVALRSPVPNGGEPLPRPLRREMAARFGEDFAEVRLHTGGPAADAAAAAGAKAYTIGQDIVFGAHNYAPQTFDGRRLLAHELAHVIQQRRGGIVPELRRSSALEAAADQAARSLAAGTGPVMVAGSAGVGIAREGDEDEIDKALAGSERTKQETDEEVRRKPDLAPKRRPTTSPTTNPPPTSSGNDSVLKEHSRETREARQRQKKGRQQDTAIEALKHDNKKLKREIVKLDRSEKKNGALSSEDKDRRDKLKATLEANQRKVGSSEVAAKTTRKSRSTSADIERDRLATIAERNRMAGGAPVEPEFGDIPEERPQAQRRGEKIPGRSEVSKQVKQSLRAKARKRFGKTMQEALRDESKHTPLTQETLKHLTPKQRNYVRRTGKMPADFEFHHLLTIADYPEFGDLAESGLAIPKDVHRQLGHGGDTTRPLEAATYIDPDALDRPGYTIDAEAKKRHRAKTRDIASGRSATPEKSGGVDADIIKERRYELQQLKRRRKPRPGDADRIKQLEWELAELRKIIPAAQPSKGAAGGETPAATPAPDQPTPRPAKSRAKGKSPPAKGDPAKMATKAPPTKAGAKRPPTDAKSSRRRKEQTAKPAAAPRSAGAPSGKAAAASPGSRARGSEPKPAGKAPPAKADAAKTPQRTRAAPTGSAVKTTAPPTRAAAPPRRARQAKAPAVPPPAPKQTQIPTPKKGGGQPSGKRAGGAAPAPSPAAKARVARAQSAPKSAPPKAPPAKPAPPPSATRAPGGLPPQQAKRSLDASRVTRPVAAPGTIGATAQAGLQATQQHGKGITTGQSFGVTGGVSIDIAEIPDSTPQQYRVTLHVEMGGEAGVSAGRESAGGGARAGISLSGSGTLSQSFSYVLSADEATQYQAAAQRGLGGKYPELEVVRRMAAGQTDAARSLLEQIHAASGSAEAAQHLGKGAIVQTSTEGSIGGGLSLGAGKAGGIGLGIEVGVFRSGKVERTVEERDGRIIVTMSIAAEKGGTLGGSVSEGLASGGYSHTGAANQLRAVSFSLDPNDKDFQAKFNSISGVSSIEELDRLRSQRPELAGATTTGEGTSHSDVVSAGFAGVGLQLLGGGSYNEQETRDERGLSHRYEGTGTGGISLTVADTPILSTSTTDTFTADVAPDNTATGETKSERNESSLLGTLFAPVAGPAAALVAGKAKALVAGKAKPPAPVDQSGAALTDESFGRLAALAEDPSAWLHAWSGNIPAVVDWAETRDKVLAAHGDRNKIARAIAEFESEGSERSGTVERAVGKTGIAFEFPQEIASQKPVYDSLVVGDPVGHARDLAERGQEQAALNELNAANDKLGKLAAAIGTSSGAFESPAKFAEMLNRIVDRRAELRTEIRQLSRPLVHAGSERQAATLRAVAAKPQIGPPAPGQKADAAAAQPDQNAELFNRVSELIQTCTRLRVQEQRTFSNVRGEMDDWHFDHLGTSIEMAKSLTAIKGSYASWDETIEKLKASYQELGQDPAKAETFAPDRKQWDAVNAQWKDW